MPTKGAKQPPPAKDKPAAEEAHTKRAEKEPAAGNGGAPGRPVRARAKPMEAGPPPTDAQKIKALEKQSKDLEDKYLRLRAEYDNHIKRTNKEKHEIITYAGSHVFRLILPILDDLRRTIDHARQDESQKDDPIVQGVELIIEKFDKLLEAEGVRVFSSVGEAFDPELHEALMTRSSNEHPDGIVLEEYEPGYKYRDKVLRHAKVVVSG